MTAPKHSRERRGMLRELARFAIVGGSAFALGAATMALLEAMGVSALIAQAPALALCVTFTWACNRRWTFAAAAPPSWGEFGRYVATSAAGLGVNAACFTALGLVGMASTPAFALSTLAAMLFNFAGYRRAVFVRR
jgi:putative flippase GtrA